MQAEGGEEGHEDQVVRQPTLHGLKQEGWWSSEERSLAEPAVGSLVLGYYGVLLG